VKLFKNDKKQKREKSDKIFIERAWDLQHRIEARQKRIGKGKYGRVLKMARKPTEEEYSKTSKITGAGILLIGGVGFTVWLLAKQVAPWIVTQLGWV
jgi:protein transport protein SEC61 subunit gamma-like protein